MHVDAFQLGIPGELPPVPLSDDESPSKRLRDDKQGTNKARQSKHGRGGGGGTGQGGSGGASLTLDMATLENLLDQQCEKILKANREHSQGLLDALEQRQATRFLSIERTVEGLEYTVEGFDARLRSVEERLQKGIPKDDEGRRRWTLVFGGWDRDTRRATILAELDQAMHKLGLRDDLDEAPFTTGPRRAVALANIGRRQGESDADRKGRMHRIVTGFSKANLVTSARRKIWAGYSKTKAERDTAGHCSWIRRVVAALSEDALPLLDCEYGTGTAWLGQSLVSSVMRDIPPGSEAGDMIVHDKDGIKGWVNIKLLAKEMKVNERKVREGLEAHKR